MRKVHNWFLVLGAVFCGILFASSTSISAASNYQSVPVSVQPIQNQYQVNNSTKFYDLEMQPGQKTTLKLKVINNSAKPIKVKVQDYSASTNSDATIVYTSPVAKYDSTMKYPLDKIVKVPKQYAVITIPKATVATYHFPVTMPQKAFKGIILGGINVSEANAKDKSKSSVKNKWAYTVAVRLSNGIDELGSIRLNKVKVGLAPNQQPAVLGTFQNPKARAVNNGVMDLKVTKQGQNRALKSIQLNNSSLAPNTNFTVAVPWKGTVAPGDYTLKGTYTSKDPQFANTKVWHFAMNFHVSAADAARYTLQNMQIPWWIYLILAVIVLLLIIVIILLVKRRKGTESHEAE